MSILTINNSNKVIISDIIVDLQCSGYNNGGADKEICTVDNYELPMMVSNYQGDVYLTFEYVSGGISAPLVLSISKNGDQPLTLSGSPYYFNSADILTLSAEIDKGYNINTGYHLHYNINIYRFDNDSLLNSTPIYFNA